ncbi:MAG: zf-HC2 domain-containing protein [Lachnospiraceae bacterium]|nr:zf-HC2 domain-containing protein [Lachnospiraceae bacterium]
MRHHTKMTCKQAVKQIPDFVSGKMSGKQLECFMEHIDSCSECKEELSIQYLIHAGLEDMDRRENYDLQSELEEAFGEARKKVSSRKFLRQTLITAAIIAGVAALILLFLLL